MHSHRDAAALRLAGSDWLTAIPVGRTDTDSITTAAQTVTGALDGTGPAGLMHNTGVAIPCPLDYLDLEDLHRQLEINLVGNWRCLRPSCRSTALAAVERRRQLPGRQADRTLRRGLQRRQHRVEPSAMRCRWSRRRVDGSPAREEGTHVRGAWDAARYDRLADPQERWGTGVVERLGDHDHVLDAGCGSGRVTEQILRRYPDTRVVALDSSPEMLFEARRRLAPWRDRVAFIQADLAAPLPPSGPFDAVLSTAVFHWIRDHANLFQSVASVLRPGGRLVAQWGGSGNIDSVLGAMREAGLPTDRWTFPTEAETVQRMRRAGFADVRVWAHPDPATFATRQELEEYLETVVLFDALAPLSADHRRQAITTVADNLPGLAVDYVRIDADATLG
jgi:trans-aconitate 2-methyltransferase